VRQATLSLALLLGLAFGSAPAAAEQGAVVRVLSEAIEVRTGPAFTYRAIHVAERGAVLRAVGRASREHWFRVVLPDGTFGWIPGDAVVPISVDPSAPAEPSLAARVADALFSPAPLPGGQVGLSFSAGVLGGEGLILFRPSLLVAPHLALEAFVGETVGEQADVLYFGGGANLYLWPSSPVTLFFALGGGGAHRREKADQFARASADGLFANANVGGGLLVALKRRITLRFDFRDYVVFDPDFARDLKEFSGGLAIVF
jgi:hypothetical protein